VDGNVLRVISRLTDDATPIDSAAYKKQVQQALAAVYPAEAGDFTQALMELGATLCGPNRKPECQACPCRDFCLAHARGTAEVLPRKNPKRPRKEEYKTVFLLRCDDRFALQKRPEAGLLAGLWQLPEVPGTLESTELSQTLESVGMQLKQIHRQTDRIHIFTHIQWHMRGFFLDTDTCAPEFTWLTAEQICQEVALPTAYKQVWDLWISEIKEEQS
jgi:A/G-specific adenine glycosylase